METILGTKDIAKRALWLIKWRFGFIFLLAAATFAAQALFRIQLSSMPLYALACAVLFYNLALLFTLKHLTRAGREISHTNVNRILNLQISADVVILTSILYFSGGVENPFFFYYIFHMILASMLLSRRMSYFQVTLAVFLFGGLLLCQYNGVLRYYGLEGFVDAGLYRHFPYLLAVFFVFASTLYGAVYLTTSVVNQLHKHQLSLEAAHEQLVHKDRLKNEYVMRVSHDIKSHLAAIKSCLDILSAHMVGSLNDEQKDLIERADRRTSRCIQFLSALLKLTRMRLTGTIEKERFSLKNSIYNSFVSVEDKAAAKNIQLHHTLDPSVDEIFGSPVLIEDTITNILINAVKYTPAGGSVQMQVYDRDDEVLIEVTDTGIGIPEDEKGRVFEEFYRASNAKKIERDGTGLGLSMAKEVVERHSGKIWLQSGPGGSTFFFTLPKNK